MSAFGQSIVRRLRDQDPLLLVGAASLLILIILTVIMLPLFVQTMQQRRGLQSRLVDLQTAIVQTEITRAAQPAILQQQIVAAENEVQARLTDWPTTEQAAQELTRYYQYASEMGVQLARVEALPDDVEQAAISAYRMDRFFIEARGSLPDLLRFMARIGSHSYSTFILNNITVRPDHPTVGQAELLLFASDLSAGARPPVVPTPVPTPAPTATAIAVDQSELLRLEVLMKQEMLQESWAAVIAYGERMLELSPGQGNTKALMYQAHVQWAEDLVSQGELAKARDHYEAALLHVPDGAQALQGQESLGMEEPLASTPTVAAGSPTATPQTLIYTVRRGDSLSVIASRYNLSVQDLVTANNLRNTTIYVGQQLVIPLR